MFHNAVERVIFKPRSSLCRRHGPSRRGRAPVIVGLKPLQTNFCCTICCYCCRCIAKPRALPAYGLIKSLNELFYRRHNV